jgi:hypothetical protein
MDGRRRESITAIGGAVVLFAVGAALYARTLGYSFVNWDDPTYVIENEWIRLASLEHLRAIFSRELLGGILPVHLLSYALDHALWGLDPTGYHLQSLVLNALNGCLAFWLVSQLARRRDVGFAAALLFAVHSTHVEAVAWVSARKELLFTLFLLLSALAYLRARRGAVFDRKAYAASLVLFALGVFSKTAIAAYPLFFLLVDWIEDGRLPAERRRALSFHVATKLPYLALAAVGVGINLLTQVTAADPLSAHALTYTLVKGQAGWRYLWLLLGIIPSQPIYDPPPVSLQPIVAALTVAPLVLPLLLFALALWRRYDQMALALGWLIAGLVPPLAFPVITFMADRYLYAPSLGFTWLLAAGIAALADTMRSRAWRTAVLATFTAGLAWWFAERVWVYTPVWRDGESLWTYAVRFSRDGRASVSLAAALREQGRLHEAAQVLEQTEVPGPRGYLNLLGIYSEQGRFEAALRAGDRALEAVERGRADPVLSAQIHAARGFVLWRLERAPEAIGAWEQALALDPANAQARELLDRARREARP